jgi:7,8-dihydropterin-6-yl-methyl-4-(beta-D-ribofuranosyl)aminobenzene 5'-phosphate synthase
MSCINYKNRDIKMQLSVLSDNKTTGQYLNEHGLSFYIKTDTDIKILFDSGSSDIFLRNAKKMSIDVDEVDFIVLSHGHWDHGNGLKYLKGKKLICHPECFIKRYRKKDDSYIGLDISQDNIFSNFKVQCSKNPYQITEDVYFLGEIPRRNSFEAKKTPFYCNDYNNDFVYDDSALAIMSGAGLIIITGCAHAGICNTVEYAKSVTGMKKVYAVIGGFHLKEVNSVALKTIKYFKKNGIERTYPCHCVSDSIIDIFYKYFSNKTISAGSSLIL